ncbi:Mitochondrial escape protein 2 [Zancudomyces culisetae]|uniref:Mitochondrial escape protein 2 n=1 Tax=Zancudomyces culisetae TaxID=1213189 RepID=A0A1R1PRB3_ZANCU|nr:Mitochondrial escape protein 2 [Zancudomyces culisetae]|eukprot:OMH83494.1 Mitochondrial escape protein 2 [Zancudomyces culisetae]
MMGLKVGKYGIYLIDAVGGARGQEKTALREIESESIERLINKVEKNNRPNEIIVISGPEGVGKGELARLAKRNKRNVLEIDMGTLEQIAGLNSENYQLDVLARMVGFMPFFGSLRSIQGLLDKIISSTMGQKTIGLSTSASGQASQIMDAVLTALDRIYTTNLYNSAAKHAKAVSRAKKAENNGMKSSELDYSEGKAGHNDSTEILLTNIEHEIPNEEIPLIIITNFMNMYPHSNFGYYREVADFCRRVAETGLAHIVLTTTNKSIYRDMLQLWSLGSTQSKNGSENTSGAMDSSSLGTLQSGLIDVIAVKEPDQNDAVSYVTYKLATISPSLIFNDNDSRELLRAHIDCVSKIGVNQDDLDIYVSEILRGAAPLAALDTVVKRNVITVKRILNGCLSDGSKNSGNGNGNGNGGSNSVNAIQLWHIISAFGSQVKPGDGLENDGGNYKLNYNKVISTNSLFDPSKFPNINNSSLINFQSQGLINVVFVDSIPTYLTASRKILLLAFKAITSEPSASQDSFIKYVKTLYYKQLIDLETANLQKLNAELAGYGIFNLNGATSVPGTTAQANAPAPRQSGIFSSILSYLGLSSHSTTRIQLPTTFYALSSQHQHRVLFLLDKIHAINNKIDNYDELVNSLSF